MSTERPVRARWFLGQDAELVAAVYITRTRPDQFHAGLYHRDHGDPRVLHFAWDRNLRDEAPDAVFQGSYGLVTLSLDVEDAQTLCALCRQVAATHPQTLRFRFAEWRPRFDPQTAAVVPATDERHGFTCATFVLAMLRSVPVPELLALEQWPAPTPDADDDRWQQKLVTLLCPTGTPLEDVANVLAGVGARRVRPTDVAGGAMLAPEHWPVGFVDSRREGERIATHLP